MATKILPPYVQIWDPAGHYRFVHVYQGVQCSFRWHGRVTWRPVPLHELSDKLKRVVAAMLSGRSYHRAYAPWMLSYRRGGDNREEMLKSRFYKVRPRKAATQAQSRAA